MHCAVKRRLSARIQCRPEGTGRETPWLQRDPGSMMRWACPKIANTKHPSPEFVSANSIRESLPCLAVSMSLDISGSSFAASFPRKGLSVSKELACWDQLTAQVIYVGAHSDVRPLDIYLPANAIGITLALCMSLPASWQTVLCLHLTLVRMLHQTLAPLSTSPQPLPVS